MAKASASDSVPSAPLSAQDLRALRARAHALKPVVRIGQTGVTDGVRRELDLALSAHELVKIHAAVDDREERARLLRALCEELGAAPVQAIGKMLVAFRARPQPRAVPTSARTRPKPRKRGAGTRAAAAKASKRPSKRARSAR